MFNTLLNTMCVFVWHERFSSSFEKLNWHSNISDIDSQSNKDYKQKLETKKEGKKKEATKPWAWTFKINIDRKICTWGRALAQVWLKAIISF